MNKVKGSILLIISLLLIIFIIPMLTTISIHSYYFIPRTEFNNNYFEYLSNNNINFTREEVKFNSYDNELTGFFYKQNNINDYNALLIFVHGINVSHENYLSEINYLTKQNYLVFSYDNTGVNYSEGKGLKGLNQSPLDLQNALNYIYDLELYNDIPNILIGHSWGGYAVCTVSQLELKREVDAIISLGGFWKNTDVLIDTAENYIGVIANVFTPYLSLYEDSLFYKYKNINGVDGLKNTKCPVLIIHSKDDTIVSFDSYLKYKSIFEDDNRFVFHEYENYSHQLTIDKDSYDRIYTIMKQDYDETLNDERNELINNLNEVVMKNITDFLDDTMKTINCSI